jgi:hypothetical protein
VLVVNHATHLPRLHRFQANPGDTALLLVRLPWTQGCRGAIFLYIEVVVLRTQGMVPCCLQGC